MFFGKPYGISMATRQKLPHKFSFVSDFAAVGIYKIEGYLVEEDEEECAGVVLIFICPNIRAYMAV